MKKVKQFLSTLAKIFGLALIILLANEIAAGIKLWELRAKNIPIKYELEIKSFAHHKPDENFSARAKSFEPFIAYYDVAHFDAQSMQVMSNHWNDINKDPIIWACGKLPDFAGSANRGKISIAFRIQSRQQMFYCMEAIHKEWTRPPDDNESQKI